jgi:hypothetical protein
VSFKSAIHARLPDRLKPVAKRVYFAAFGLSTDEELHSAFVADVFQSRAEYDRYAREFKAGQVVALRDEALQRYQQLTGRDGLAGIGLDTARDYYAITRKLEPETVIETGVCNGVSTLSILLALQKNGSGELYSIDSPLRADESLEEFRAETFEGYGGAAIPSDKEPGWIIPDELRSRWDLTIGKSQRELPKLVTELETVDLFVHDSEHSHPCMMFEYELAYEWLVEGGVVLSDDITWNDAFSIFTRVRQPEWGKVSRTVGYMRKSA